MPQVKAPRAAGLVTAPGAASLALTVLTDDELPIERDTFGRARGRAGRLAS